MASGIGGASKGLFCQLILIPLLQRQRIRAQVAGHELPVIKQTPPLAVSEPDLDWIAHGFGEVIGDSQSLGSMVDLGRTLAAMRCSPAPAPPRSPSTRSPAGPFLEQTCQIDRHRYLAWCRDDLSGRPGPREPICWAIEPAPFEAIGVAAAGRHAR